MPHQTDTRDSSQMVGPESQVDSRPTPDEPFLLTEPSLAEPEPDLRASIGQPPKAKPSPRGGLGFMGALLGGLLAAAAGFGLAKYAPDGWPIQDVSALQKQIDAQTLKIQELTASLPKPGNLDLIDHRLAAVEAAASNPTPLELQPLQSRVASLETALAALSVGPGVGDVAQKLLQIQGRIDSLESGPKLSPEALAAVDTRIKEADAATAAAKAEAASSLQKAAQTVALSRISTALDSGVAFSDLLADIGVPAPDALIAVSEAGAPTLATLQTDFPKMARRALDASQRTDMGSSWTARVTNFLKTQTGARSLTPKEGTDPDAVLSRAEAALTSGDLQAALVELAALPKESQEAMADWQTLAQKRLAAIKAFAEFSVSLGQ